MQDIAPSQTSHRASELKEAFTALKRDQNEVLALFKSVSDSLNANPSIGEKHPLAKKWQDIRQEYREAMQAAQRNASRCASLLSQSSLSLPLILAPDMLLDAKLEIIQAFLKEAHDGQQRAEVISKAFEDLSDRLTSFPKEVKECRSDNKFWTGLWKTLTGLCERVLQAINRIVRWLLSTLLPMGRVRLNCGPFRAEYIPLSPSCGRKSPPPASPAELEDRVLRDCADTREHILDITSIWSEVGLSFDELHTILERAENLVCMSPTYCTMFVKQAEEVYTPLIEGLRAYSSNRRPEF